MKTRMLLVLSAAALCSACLRATTVITVRPDGSGTIDQEIGMTAFAAGFMKGLGDAAAEAGAEKTEKKKDTALFGEAEARKAGEQMGVRFLSGEPIKNDRLEGYRAKYAFDDIAKLTLNKEGATGLPSPGGATGSTVPPYGFQFTKGKDASTLVINMPPLDSSKLQGSLGGMPGEAGKPGSDAMEKQGLAMMKMLMNGMFVDVTLAVEGKIRKANVPVADGGRITLVQLDFDKLLEDPTGMDKLRNAKDAKALQSVPGLKVPLDPKLTIEFGR